MMMGGRELMMMTMNVAQHRKGKVENSIQL
jgi:hypothetical protein